MVFKKLKEEFKEEFIKLEKTDQEPEWHREGNVLIHTKMVVETLKRLEEYKSLSEKEQEIVMYAAVLHDIGKPETTKVEEGRITSKNHSIVGEKKARVMLRNYKFEFREAVCLLIRYHGYPIHYWKKNEKEIVDMSYKVYSLKLLYILAKADLLGRLTSEEGTEDSLANIDYFKEKAEICDCYEKEKFFKSERSKMHFLKTGEIYDPYVEKKSKVYVMSGIPGSGKDNYIKRELKNIKEISLDKIRREMKVRRGNKKEEGRLAQEAKSRAKVLLAAKEDFIWNGTNTNAGLRRDLISIFLEYGAYVSIIYVERNLEEVLRDNKKREASVPEEYIRNKFKYIDIPDRTECHELIIEV